jgi:hypothetical protein
MPTLKQQNGSALTAQEAERGLFAYWPAAGGLRRYAHTPLRF